MAGIDSATGVLFSSGEDFFDHILNDMFLPAVADTVINPNELLRILPRDKTRVQGKNVVYPIHIGRNLGGNAIAAGGDLPDPGSQQYDGYSFPIRHIYQRILFDGISMDASRTDVASWLRVVESEVKGASMDMARRRNRIFNNDGSGRLAEVATGGVSGTTITAVVNPDIEQGAGVPSADFAPTKFIKVGARVQFSEGPSFANANTTTVASITSDTVFEVASGTGITQNDWITEVSVDTAVPTVATSSGFQNEPMGLAGIFSDADPNDGVTGFQGILSAAGDGFNQANVLDNSGTLRDLSEALLQKAYSDTIRIGEGNVDCLFGSFGIVNTYIDLLIADKRFNSPTNLEGGSTAVTFNGIPWIADRDAYSNRVYFLDKSNIRVYVLAEPQWMNYDGSSYHRLENKDAYQATLFCREQLGVDVRDKCTLLVDLNEI